jgi:DsbC/DsbD-like thiol-disulfide interchange protein
VCEKLCVPAEGSADLLLTNTTPGTAVYDEALAAAEARVPKPASLGDGAGLAIRDVRQEPGERYPRIVVDMAAPEGQSADLFAEGPTAEWALPVPAPIGGGPSGTRRFAFDLAGLPPGASAHGALLTLTAVAGGSAIEVTARID